MRHHSRVEHVNVHGGITPARSVGSFAPVLCRRLWKYVHTDVRKPYGWVSCDRVITRRMTHTRSGGGAAGPSLGFARPREKTNFTTFGRLPNVSEMRETQGPTQPPLRMALGWWSERLDEKECFVYFFCVGHAHESLSFVSALDIKHVVLRVICHWVIILYT